MIGGAAAHRLMYAIGLHKAESQLSAGERDCLLRHAQGKRRLAELGIFEGASTALLIAAADEHGEVFGIDPFFRGRLGVSWGRGIALGEIARACSAKPHVRVNVVERLSHVAAREIAGSFDFVFVDGDHSDEGIRRDWEDWSGRISPDGLIALHDTAFRPDTPHSAMLGSHRYFESTIRFDDRFTLVEQVDSLSVLRRC